MKKSLYSHIWLYLAIFICILILLNATFHILSFIYRPAVLLPISYTAYFILKVLSIPAVIYGPLGMPGYYEYHLPQAVLQVTFGCTGIFVLFILLAGIIAFPSSLKSKLVGLTISLPSFFVYSIVRLVIMGIIGNSFPAKLDFIHSYLMEVTNIIFILLVYIIWIRYVEKTPKAI